MRVTDTLKALLPRKTKEFIRPYLPKSLKAQYYVGSDKVSGKIQVEILKREGCLPESKVLEMGCGHLHTCVPLAQYLNAGNYVGVDPNEWLRNDALKSRSVRRLVAEKQVRFLSREDFDPSAAGMKFDFVVSHSVLSHAAHHQLEQFLRNIGKSLAPQGRILASMYLAEGNAFGSNGSPDKKDSMDKEWQYPGISHFKLSTVEATADRVGMVAVRMPQYTELYTKTRHKECHDWMLFHWKRNGASAA